MMLTVAFGLILALWCVPDGWTMDTEITRRAAAAVALAPLAVWGARRHGKAALAAAGVLALGAWWGISGRGEFSAPWYGLFEALLWSGVLAAGVAWKGAEVKPEVLGGFLLAQGLVVSVVCRAMTGEWALMPVEVVEAAGINANTLGHVAALGVLGAVWLCLVLKQPWRFVGLAGAAWLLPLVAAQDSKAAWLALGAGLTALAVMRVRGQALKIGLVVGAVAVVLVAGKAGLSGEDFQEQKTLRERTWMAVNALVLIKDRPLTGWGLGSFPVTSLAISPQVTGRWPVLRQEKANVPLNPHSEVLGLAHDLGMPLMLGLLGWVAYQVRRRMSLLPFFVAVGLLALVEFPLHVTPLALLMALALVSKTEEEESVASGWKQAVLGLPLAVMAAVMGWGMLTMEREVMAAGMKKDYSAKPYIEDWRMFGIAHPVAGAELGVWWLKEAQETQALASKPPYKEAVKAFRAAMQGRATARNLNNFGVALRRSGNSGEAARRFEQAIRLEPTYCDAWYNLALALRDIHFRDRSQEEDAFRQFRLCQLGKGG